MSLASTIVGRSFTTRADAKFYAAERANLEAAKAAVAEFIATCRIGAQEGPDMIAALLAWVMF